jgi:anaerobic magnesium-protoporphyrin IX monomethyl ester cyclase
VDGEWIVTYTHRDCSPVTRSRVRPQGCDVNITVVFPPAADPSLPYAALPLLGAVLRRGGYHDVVLRDVNLEAFESLLTAEVLGPVAGRMAGAGAEVLKDLDAARAVLRDREAFYDPARLLYAKRTLHLAGDLLSSEHPGIRFGKYSYSGSAYDSYEDIDRAVRSDGGPLLPYLREVTVPSLLARSPAVVGLSVPYFSQLVPAILLAGEIRRQDPGVHLTTGGPVITWGKEVLAADPRFARWFDSFFVGEAEETFLRFVEALDGRRDLASVPNVVRYVGGTVVDQTDHRYQLDLDWPPAPDYTMMPMQRYLAPKRIICMMLTRGCYFNKCAFCNYAFIKMAPYRMRSPRLIGDDIAAVQQATGEDVFCFESDVMLPRHLREISQTILERGLDIRWHGVARFEKGMDQELFHTMRRAGCVRLYMGLESANDRILKLMVKGTDRARMSEILAMCHAAGIGVEAGVFSGFPSETAEEAEDTYRFVRDHQHAISRADVGTFRLLKGAPIAEAPQTYGISVVGDPGKRWYHLEYEDSVPGPEAPTTRSMAKLQRLYPEVALVDVPEDILYAAERGPDVLHGFFGTGRQEGGSAPWRAPDGEMLRLAPGCRLLRIRVTNSGAVHFEDDRPADPGGSADGGPVFEVSSLTVPVVVDSGRFNVYPLDPAEERVVRLVAARPVPVEAARRAAVADDEDARGDGPACPPSLLERLVDLGLLELWSPAAGIRTDGRGLTTKC